MENRAIISFMYKAIIVDDEIWAIRGLSGIIPWEKFGFTICATCTGVDEALAAIEKHNPEIVFTDIRMSQKSGLELINSTSAVANKLFPLIVIVSAYKDFEVAKHAIKKGVFDYLLKPLERDVVADVARSAFAEIETRKKHQDDFSFVDLSAPESLTDAGVLRMLREVGVTNECYIIVSKNELKSEVFFGAVKPGGEHSGTSLRQVRVSGFQFAYLFSGELPNMSLSDVGISCCHENFDAIPEMIKEACFSYYGGFIFSNNSVVSSMQKYIATHYKEKLSISQLADAFNVSEPYVYELFKKHAENTVLGFQQDIRMHYAERLLKDTDKPIGEIAAEVGYDDIGYFGRVFKKHFDCSPSCFR